MCDRDRSSADIRTREEVWADLFGWGELVCWALLGGSLRRADCRRVNKGEKQHG